MCFVAVQDATSTGVEAPHGSRPQSGSNGKELMFVTIPTVCNIIGHLGRLRGSVYCTSRTRSSKVNASIVPAPLIVFSMPHLVTAFPQSSRPSFSTTLGSIQACFIVTTNRFRRSVECLGNISEFFSEPQIPRNLYLRKSAPKALEESRRAFSILILTPSQVHSVKPLNFTRR